MEPILPGPSRFLDTLVSEEISNNVFKVRRLLPFYSKRLNRIFDIQPLICDFETAGLFRTSNEAGALHDYGYRIDCPWGLSRREVDDLYFEALLADGNTSHALAMSKWLAVRVFGKRYFQKNRIKASADEIALVNERARYA